MERMAYVGPIEHVNEIQSRRRIDLVRKPHRHPFLSKRAPKSGNVTDEIASTCHGADDPGAATPATNDSTASGVRSPRSC